MYPFRDKQIDEWHNHVVGKVIPKRANQINQRFPINKDQKAMKLKRHPDFGAIH